MRFCALIFSMFSRYQTLSSTPLHQIKYGIYSNLHLLNCQDVSHTHILVNEQQQKCVFVTYYDFTPNKPQIHSQESAQVCWNSRINTSLLEITSLNKRKLNHSNLRGLLLETENLNKSKPSSTTAKTPFKYLLS